jgi:hypothetical protein
MIELLVFDAVIGNSDRHHDNWSLILRRAAPSELAPGYDHGSSLGSHIEEHRLQDAVQNEPLERYVRRGCSRVGWREGERTQRLTHVALLKRLRHEHPEPMQVSLQKIWRVDIATAQSLVDAAPEAYASAERRTLII